MSSSDRRVIALGNLAGELKTALESAVRGAGLELLLTREPARAFVELERDGALAVLVDMATLGAEQFCKRARGTERLRSVPVIGMSRHPNELGFARVFAWGADDLVPLGARLPLERRLQVLRDTPTPDTSGFGQAVVAEATTQRRALVGRVLAQAGYEVKFAVDRGAVELYASQSETRLVVISAALGDPRRIIEAAAKAGALPTWIVTVEARSTARLASSLAGLDRVAVTSTAGSPEDVLFLANELVFSKGARRREWRALYATPVAFRPEGTDSDEYGFSYDASPRGLYVRSLLPCASESVEVELRLPNRDERVRLAGKVAKRFAFGSGAIASAPPGFSVHLEGPEPALARWIDACSELIAAASSESMPPRPRSSSQPVLQSPGLGGKEVTLAVPPATVSIESVVAPLPIGAEPSAKEGADVGELLAATLDEQTLTEVGTRPVTIGKDGGVREERPSEFGAGLSSLAPPSGPLPSASSPPPVELPSTPPLEDAITLPPAADPEPAPATPHSIDWDSDAKTTVRESQPFVGEPPEPVRDVEPPAPVELAAVEPTAPAPVRAAPQSAPRAAEVLPERLAPVPTKEASPAAFAATVVGPPPVPRRALGSAPNIAPPPPSRSSPTAVGAPRAGSSPDAVATPPVAAAPEPPPPAPSTNETLPLGFPKQATPVSAPEPAPAARHDPAPEPPVAKRETSPEPPFAAKRTPAPRPPEPTAPSRGGRFWIFAVAAAAATVIGVGAGFVMHEPAPRAAPPPSVAVSPAPTLASPSGTADTAAAAARPAAAATQTTPATPVAPSASASAAPLASTAASSTASSATAAPTTLPSAGSASGAPATTPGPASATTPAPAPVASVDLRRLAADRGALIVHSSVSAHVFVHGTDYGETNRPLVTSCGIRFVRLGRGPGDFLEPGRSYVLKCGRLNELTIEP